MKLSVIVVDKNGGAYPEPCLYSVFAALSGLTADVWMVNTKEPTTEIALPDHYKIHIIEDNDGGGYLQAAAKAIQQSKGDYILLLHSTTIIGEETPRTLCYFMDEHPEAGGIGVKMMDEKGDYIPESKQAFPTYWDSFCRWSGLTQLFPHSALFSHAYHPDLDPEKEHQVDVLSKGFMFLRREAWDVVTQNREKEKPYYKDELIELSYRMKKEGYLNYYIPERVLLYPQIGKREQEGASKKVPIRKKNKYRRLLIMCKEKDFDGLKRKCVKRMPELQFVNLWDLDVERVMDAICRRNQMKGFTDYAFYYPDVRFEQMLLFMDKMSNKNISYHLFNEKSHRLISFSI